MPDGVRAALTDNVGAALEVSHQLGANGTEVAAAARAAFVSSMSGSLWVGVGLAALATVIAFVHLPNRAPGHGGHGHGLGAHAAHAHAHAAQDEVTVPAFASHS